ncbi:MAG: hypothetical protein HQL65_12820 [Magnetococcales bacterium]|nr:hypothetical protein [Magnetococcales bacterium]
MILSISLQGGHGYGGNRPPSGKPGVILEDVATERLHSTLFILMVSEYYRFAKRCGTLFLLVG